MASISAQKDPDTASKATTNRSDGKNGTAMPAVPALQTKAAPEEKPKQLKPFQGDTFQKQASCVSPLQHRFKPIQKAKNDTGLPDNLKTGIETLSGFSMNDVKVHYNSAKPTQLQAFAYAQGTDIHIVPGQEKHLPHEAWHVAQQKQGRVQPTMQMKAGVAVNDDKGLESEADTMGAKAINIGQLAKMGDPGILNPVQYKSDPGFTIQFYKPSSTQKIALLDTMNEKWGKAIVKFDAKPSFIIAALTRYCKNHSQAMSILGGMPYEEWCEIKKKEMPVEVLIAEIERPVVVEEPEGVTEGKEQIVEEKSKPAIKTKIAKQMIRATKYSLAMFSDTDLAAICAAKDPEEAIKAIGDRKEREKLVAAKEAKYSGAKEAGDLIFTAGLIKEIWDYSYAVAIGGGGLNATLETQHSDEHINAAAAIWHSPRRSLPKPPKTPLAKGTPGYDTKYATNFHVPGAPVYIQDKKTRSLKPDPERRRQADFICKWGELKINVHVDSETRRL